MEDRRLKDISLTVIVPGLNEEKCARPAVEEVIAALRKTVLNWDIIFINDGSTDRTGEIAEELAEQEDRIKVIHHDRPRGVGYSLMEGIRASSKTVVTWVPADGENDPYELLKYLPLIEYVDIVIPFVIKRARKVRPLHRRVLSAIYLTIINTTFGTRFNYTNGNIIYRRSVFEVVSPRSNGFLVHAECLVRAIRAGFIFAEVPVTLKNRLEGISKAILFKAVYKVVREYFSLLLSMYVLREKGGKKKIEAS